MHNLFSRSAVKIGPDYKLIRTQKSDLFKFYVGKIVGKRIEA